LIKKYKRKIKSNIEKYINIHYEKINKSQMVMGEGLFNHRCQYNAVQQVKSGNMKEVYSCLVLNDTHFPVVHFINRNKDWKFVDNTLGWKFEQYDYYIMKKIEEDQYNSIDDILNESKEALLNLNSSRFKNKLFFIDAHNLGI
jgi:hypothetical protein